MGTGGPGLHPGGGHRQRPGLPHQAPRLLAGLPLPLGLVALCQGQLRHVGKRVVNVGKHRRNYAIRTLRRISHLIFFLQHKTSLSDPYRLTFARQSLLTRLKTC